MFKESSDKYGLFRYGYVKDFQIARLQTLLEGTNLCISNSANIGREIDNLLDKENLIKYDFLGRDKFDGQDIQDEYVAILRIPLHAITSKGEQIYCWFEYDKSGNTSSFSWGSQTDWEEFKFGLGKFFLGFSENDSGLLCFDGIKEANNFLRQIEKEAIKENWKLKSHEKSKISYPVLSSYLAFTFYKLVTEYQCFRKDRPDKVKLGFSNDGKFVAFNSNLLDRHWGEIYICGELKTNGDDLLIYKPRRCTRLELTNRYHIQLSSSTLKPAEFFTDINDVVYHADWPVEKENFTKYEHCIKRLQERYPDREITSKELNSAIEISIKLAQRNYKLIVPMYYPAEKRIQFLMPLYFGDAETLPDCALVLSPMNEATKYYMPETIFDLDQAYMDARLIAKPDSEWLRSR